jgi:hypothetical protein
MTDIYRWYKYDAMGELGLCRLLDISAQILELERTGTM